MGRVIPDKITNKRAGGRSARQALRSSPLAKELRPVKPGLIGGAYNPLSHEEILKIHEAALQVHAPRCRAHRHGPARARDRSQYARKTAPTPGLALL